MKWSTSDRFDIELADWLDTRIINVFPIEESSPDRFGLVSVASASVELDNTDYAVSDVAGDLMGKTVELRHTIERRLNDVVIDYNVLKRKLKITRISYADGIATLQCENAIDPALATLYPKHVWSADEWPDIYPDHEGMIIPEISGQNVGVNCAYLGEIDVAGSPRWRYGVCAFRNQEQTVQVNTILRATREAATRQGDGTLRDNLDVILAYESTMLVRDSSARELIAVLVIDFVLDQTQYGSGNPHPISCIVSSESSVYSGRDRNAGAEIRRLLEAAEVDVDTTGFDAVESYCTEQNLLIDYAYREQRRVDALLEELLLIARATLIPNSDGQLSIIQDSQQTIDASTPVYDISAGDEAKIEQVEIMEPPQSVEAKYAPWFINPDSELVNRDGYEGHMAIYSPDGTGPSRRLPDFQMIRDWEVASRIVGYWHQKTAITATMLATVTPPLESNGKPVFFGIGDVIGINDPGTSRHARYWRVTAARTGAGDQSLNLELYADSVYVYRPQEAKRKTRAKRTRATTTVIT